MTPAERIRSDADELHSPGSVALTRAAAAAEDINATPKGSPARNEVRDILGAVIGLYVRPWMALRVVTIAAEAGR